MRNTPTGGPPTVRAVDHRSGPGPWTKAENVFVPRVATESSRASARFLKHPVPSVQGSAGGLQCAITCFGDAAPVHRPATCRSRQRHPVGERVCSLLVAGGQTRSACGGTTCRVCHVAPPATQLLGGIGTALGFAARSARPVPRWRFPQPAEAVPVVDASPAQPRSPRGASAPPWTRGNTALGGGAPSTTG